MPKINVNNTAKIQDFINEVQQLARVRRIDAQDVQVAAVQAEAYLDELMGMKDRNGIALDDINLHAQTFASSYKGTPESTYFSLIRGSKDWFLTRVWRQTCGQKRHAAVVFKAKHQEAIAQKAKQHFEF